MAKWLYSYRDDLPKNLFKITAQVCKMSLLKLPIFQPRSQGSLLPIPTERERRVGERTWERGCLFLFQFGGCGSHCFNFDKFRHTASLKEGVEP